MRMAAVNAISVTFATALLLLLPTATLAESVDCNLSSGLPIGERDIAGMVFIPGGAFRIEPGQAPRRVIKGGSYQYASKFCARYRPSARQPQEADLSAAHIGFRTVLNRQPKEG